MLSIGNSVQAYLTLTYTRRVYSAPATVITPLSARTFGTWTLLSSIVRLYAALNIHDPLMYRLALLTYVVAWGHFVSEWLVFKTARCGLGLAAPLCVATASLVWMLGCWDWYVR